VVGNGTFDLVFVPQFVSHVEQMWYAPGVARCEATSAITKGSTASARR